MPDGYDLVDTVSDQVYGGSDGEQSLTDTAVQQTAGLIATYGGSLDNGGEWLRLWRPAGGTNEALVDEVFELRETFEWRGLGSLPFSALRLRPAFAEYDAELKFSCAYVTVPDHKACECAAILRGEKSPPQCKIFGTVCTPENPIGSCMVSSEGACAAHYSYGRFR